MWTTPDPIGVLGGVNLYGYVHNNPVNKIDFLGLDEPGNGHGPDGTGMSDTADTSTDTSTEVSSVSLSVDNYNLVDETANPLSVDNYSLVSPEGAAESTNSQRYPGLSKSQCYQECYAASAISCGLIGLGTGALTGGLGGFVAGAACSDFMSNACDAECDPDYDGCLTGKCDG